MNAVTQTFAALIGSLGFAIVFGTKKKYWALIALDGMLSWMLYLFCCQVTTSFFANFITAAFCSLYAHTAARIVKVPTTCLLMPATVPMIPGGSLYYTMASALAGNAGEFKIYALSTGQTIFAMAMGFALITLSFRTYEKRSASH